MRQHIDLYVNNYSVSLGKYGVEAVEKFVSIYEKNNPGQKAQKLSLIS